jgi:hypothetical protein
MRKMARYPVIWQSLSLMIGMVRVLSPFRDQISYVESSARSSIVPTLSSILSWKGLQ